MATKPVVDLKPLAHELLPVPLTKDAQDAVRAELPYAGVKPGEITSQQEKFVHLVISGMAIGAAAVAVGATPSAGSAWGRDPRIKSVMEHLRAKNREQLGFTIETAHTMLMEAWTNCADATEQVAVVRELVKLHGVAATPKPQEINVNVMGPKQIERATDAQLLEVAGMSLDDLMPQRKIKAPPPSEVVDAEYVEVKK